MITRQICEDTIQAIERDRAMIGVAQHLFKDTGLAERLGFVIDEARLDPYRPCPPNWTALQIAYFDNGERGPVRKRPKIQRTKMQWGGNIKVWTRADISFSNPKQIAWQANFHLWTAQQAREIVQDLLQERYVGQETVDLINDATADHDDQDLRFSIPMLKIGAGTRWMRSHLVISAMHNCRPTAAILIMPGQKPFRTSADFSDVMPDGKPFSGNAVCQARLAREPKFSQWATEIIA